MDKENHEKKGGFIEEIQRRRSSNPSTRAKSASWKFLFWLFSSLFQFFTAISTVKTEGIPA